MNDDAEYIEVRSRSTASDIEYIQHRTVTEQRIAAQLEIAWRWGGRRIVPGSLRLTWTDQSEGVEGNVIVPPWSGRWLVEGYAVAQKWPPTNGLTPEQQTDEVIEYVQCDWAEVEGSAQ